jgi:hypothetical protein
MKFRPQLAEHSVRRLRITHTELAAAGVTATFDNVLEPETWKDALDLRVGDEIEVIGTDLERVIRVVSVGPEGCATEHISGRTFAPKTRHAFLCRELQSDPHLFALYQQESGAWQRLAPGQTSLMPLVEELSGLIARDGNADITIVPFDLARVKALFADGDAALPEADILLPEGTADPDRWVWGVRDHRGERVAERFHKRTLPEQIRDWFYYRSNCPFGTRDPEWRVVEKLWGPAGDVLLIRPGWSARQLRPRCFQSLQSSRRSTSGALPSNARRLWPGARASSPEIERLRTPACPPRSTRGSAKRSTRSRANTIDRHDRDHTG